MNIYLQHILWVLGQVAIPIAITVAAVAAVLIGLRVFPRIAASWRVSSESRTPILFAFGALFLIGTGSLIGVIQSQATSSRAFSDSYFFLAHLRYVMSLSAVFGIFAGVYFWLGKMSGRQYPLWAGKLHFWMLFTGTTLIVITPQVMSRQTMVGRYTTESNAFSFWNLASMLGVLAIAASFLLFLWILTYVLLWGKRAA